MSKNEGGYAFPTINESSVHGCSSLDYLDGMSLRDYFAGQALAGLLTLSAHPQAPRTPDLVKVCVETADALIEELNK